MADSDNPSSASESVAVTTSLLSKLANLARTGNFPITDLNVRQRRKVRVDGLGHLVVDTEPKTSEQLECLRDISSYLIWLERISPHVLYTASNQFSPYFSRNILDDFIETSPQHPEEPHYFMKTDIGSLYEPSFRTNILRDRETKDIDYCLSVIKDTSRCQFYGLVLRTQLRVYRILDRIITPLWSKGAEGLVIPDWYLATFDEGSPTSKEDYFEHLSIKCDEQRYRLVRLMRLILGLREAVRRAARYSFLDDASLRALKSHLEPFHDDYSDANDALGSLFPYGKHFIDPYSEQWWITDKVQKPDSPKAPSRVSDAYPFSSAMRSSLNFVVPTVMLLAVVPAALAWKYDSNRKGDWKDSQLHQTIAGNVIQLLGLVMFVWPTWSHPRLSVLNWLWIWLLAGFSAICALVSIALYVTVSSTWSFIVAFAGVLAQTIVQLQVINAI